MNRLTIKVLPKQQLPPVVSAGPDDQISLPNNQTQIVGTASDQDGSIASIVWSQISGPLATLQTPNQLTLLVSNLNEGVYTFQITVTDDDGLVASDTMQLTVLSANEPPISVPGADQTIQLPDNTAQLKGFGTDSDGVIVSTQWAVVSKPIGSNPFFTPNNNDPDAEIVGLDVAGDYVVQLTVTDNDGATDTDTLLITVDAITQNPPVINSVGPLRDDNGSFMGNIPGSIDTRNHDQPWSFLVNFTDVDQHNVSVNAEIRINGNLVVSETNVVNTFNPDGTAQTLIGISDPLIVGNNSNIAQYILTITLTDADGLTATQDYSIGLFNSQNSGTVNGGLPSQSASTPDSFNSCFTFYSGTFVVPAGQTGSLSSVVLDGSIANISGTTLNNVGPGTYNWSASLDNSGTPNTTTKLRLNSSLSGGDNGTLILDRNPGHSSQWDKAPC